MPGKPRRTAWLTGCERDRHTLRFVAATEDDDVKMKAMLAAVTLMTTTLVGCGEQRGAQPGGEASARPAALAAPSAAPTAAPVAVVCPPAAASVAPPEAPRPPVKVKATTEGALVVKRLVVAPAVKGREPVDPATSFKADSGKIYAFVELENKEATESEITVSFEAPDGKSATGNVKLDVGAEPRWRTWAYTRAARTAGSWTAIVKDHRGDVLARAPFEVTL
jgi:hypothetical protein